MYFIGLSVIVDGHTHADHTETLHQQFKEQLGVWWLHIWGGVITSPMELILWLNKGL